MPDYQKGKIYKIISPSTGLTYYGCTVESLSSRMRKHRYDYKHMATRKKSTRAYKVLACGDAKIYLVEKYPCNDVEELHAREGYYQQNFECVNLQISGRTREQYRRENREKIAANKKQYHIKIRDKHLKKTKQYYQDTREKQKKYKTTKIICECGSVVSKTNLSEHIKTMKHQQYMLNPFSHM